MDSDSLLLPTPDQRLASMASSSHITVLSDDSHPDPWNPNTIQASTGADPIKIGQNARRFGDMYVDIELLSL